MGGPKSKASREEILTAFSTEEPFKAFALRIGMSPNTLRGIWKEAFGEDAFKERGKRLQAKAATITCKTTTAHGRVYKDVSVTCSECGGQVVLKSNQVAQMTAGEFVCEGCRCDRACPVCGLPVDGERGLAGHFRHRREAGDAAHAGYREVLGEKRWEGLKDGEDYVACRVCGHRAETLARHLKAAHGITADVYRGRYGDVRIRSVRLERARSEVMGRRDRGFGKGDRKTVVCPSCGTPWEGSKFLVQGTHDFRCASCRKKAEEARWAGKTEPQDYVTCLDCGYRAENLTSHVQNSHQDYGQRNPEALMIALSSSVRDKMALRGIQRPPEFGEKIRQAKLLNLTLDDFQPFLESDGSVDHIRMAVGTDCDVVTVRKYAIQLGVEFTSKYRLLAAEAHRKTLTAEDLQPFTLKNKKISIALATMGLKMCNVTLKKECRRLGLSWAHGNIAQRKCLEALTIALGGIPFREEWMSWRFVNPATGFRFRFDGYFPAIGLVTEFQGNFHTVFPSHFFPTESYRPVYEALRERDRIKRELIQAAPDLIYFEVLEEEPYDSADYLKGRLVQMGVLPR